MTFLEHIITPSSRRGKKPPESTASSLAVSFVTLGRNTLTSPGVVGLHRNLKVHHIQIFGGYKMPQSYSYENFRKNFSYVFPARTLYQLRLEAESNGRAVRA